MPPASERVKAVRVRKRLAAGKPQPGDREWIAAYEKRTTRTTIRRGKAIGGTYRPKGHDLGGGLRFDATTHVIQPALPAPSASDAHVHTTEPPKGTIDPTAHLWTPTVPAATNSDVPPPGAPPPPLEGSSVLGQAPIVDEKAGTQLAWIVCTIAMFGFRCAQEMLAELEIPDELKPYLIELASPENVAKGLGELGAACKRLALKYQLTSIPMSDELLVGGVVAASGFAIMTKVKRKKLGAAPKKREVAAAPVPPPPPEPAPDEPDAQPVPDVLTGVWRGPR